MSRRSTGFSTPPTPDDHSRGLRAERATTPPPAEYDPDEPPPSRRATEPPVADYASMRESCSEFQVGLRVIEPAAMPAPPVPPNDSHFVFAAVLVGDDLDWFPLSDASRRVVDALDGEHPMREVAARLEMDIEEACGVARELLARGIISLRRVG
jgi:hypothetical protein